MQPYLTNLVNRLMRQRSGIGTDEKRFPPTGNLVDQTFRMFHKRTDTAPKDQILVADMLNESGQELPKRGAEKLPEGNGWRETR